MFSFCSPYSLHLLPPLRLSIIFYAFVSGICSNIDIIDAVFLVSSSAQTIDFSYGFAFGRFCSAFIFVGTPLSFFVLSHFWRLYIKPYLLPTKFFFYLITFIADNSSSLTDLFPFIASRLPAVLISLFPDINM